MSQEKTVQHRLVPQQRVRHRRYGKGVVISVEARGTAAGNFVVRLDNGHLKRETADMAFFWRPERAPSRLTLRSTFLARK